MRTIMVLLGKSAYGHTPEDETVGARWLVVLALMVGVFMGRLM